jgi:serine protease Do
MTLVRRFIVVLSLLGPLSAQANAAQVNLPDFTGIVESNSAAVVKILVEVEPVKSAPQGDMTEPDGVPDYLRRFFDPRGGIPRGDVPRSGTGSGFILTEDGYVVTNNHVVEGATSVVVRMTDRREFDAEIVGLDELSDLALLKIDAEDLPTLKLAEPDSLKVGEWVLAIGSPFGLDFSVTAGIVSAMGRSLPTATNDNYVPFIQTDVAINPGNSGGPLFNLEGEVVGVNSQIYTRSGGSIGLSFSIPVSVVRDVVEQLRDSGAVQRGWLGVSIQNVDKNLAEAFGLDRPAGALVAQVVEGSPAEEAGIREGDVIVEFDGEYIETSSELPHVVGLVKPGSEVKVGLIRDGDQKTLSVEVGALSPRADLAKQIESASGGARLGLTVEPAADQLLSELGLASGVVVRAVRADSAADGEIVEGDIITMLGSKAVRSTQDFIEAEQSLREGQSIQVRLWRRGTPLFIGLRVPND